MATSARPQPPDLRFDPRPEPTIRDVARQAGVSTATVSRVISGSVAARPQTRARVLAVAEALGYRPSAVARSLKLRTTRTLGLLVTDIQNPYYPEIVRAVEDAALERNLAVLLCNGADDPAREETYLELLVDRRVDGIIIASSGLQERHGAWLARRSVPVVLVNWAAPDLPLPAILGDNRAGGRLATEHLLSLGHRRIGHLSAPARNAAAAERLGGIGDALAGGGLDPGSLVVVEGDGQVAGGERAALELLERMPEITGIVCYNDLTAIGAVRALRARGRQVPADVSIVGYDDIALSAWVDPPLTTIAQRTSEMGRWAVRRLGELIGRADGAASGDGSRMEATGDGVSGSLGPPPVILPVELRVRASTAAPRESP
ncbi:MAG: LacI family DNA-binding transcriptional regulator [Candidatus Limnocylindrales bacterium]|nr:LacI family DNA-binding transcriptional regulator [Candidatus Limnocylindrales bacterium]